MVKRQTLVIGLAATTGPFSGKSHAATLLEYWCRNEKITPIRLSLATPVKLIGNTIIEEAFQKDPTTLQKTDELSPGYTVRQLYIDIGTTAGRKLIDEDLWINILYNALTKIEAATSGPVVFLIDDVRMMNEIHFIEETCGGCVFNVYDLSSGIQRQPDANELTHEAFDKDETLYNCRGSNLLEAQIQEKVLPIIRKALL